MTEKEITFLYDIESISLASSIESNEEIIAYTQNTVCDILGNVDLQTIFPIIYIRESDILMVVSRSMNKNLKDMFTKLKGCSGFFDICII